MPRLRTLLTSPKNFVILFFVVMTAIAVTTSTSTVVKRVFRYDPVREGYYLVISDITWEKTRIAVADERLKITFVNPPGELAVKVVISGEREGDPYQRPLLCMIVVRDMSGNLVKQGRKIWIVYKTPFQKELSLSYAYGAETRVFVEIGLTTEEGKWTTDVQVWVFGAQSPPRLEDIRYPPSTPLPISEQQPPPTTEEPKLVVIGVATFTYIRTDPTYEDAGIVKYTVSQETSVVLRLTFRTREVGQRTLVIFFDGAEFYRTTARPGSTHRINIPSTPGEHEIAIALDTEEEEWSVDVYLEAPSTAQLRVTTVHPPAVAPEQPPTEEEPYEPPEPVEEPGEEPKLPPPQPQEQVEEKRVITIDPLLLILLIVGGAVLMIIIVILLARRRPAYWPPPYYPPYYPA